MVIMIKDKLNEPINWSRVKFIAVYLILIIVDQLIEGSAVFPSVIGTSL
jgi:hypothetical protein